LILVLGAFTGRLIEHSTAPKNSERISICVIWSRRIFLYLARKQRFVHTTIQAEEDIREKLLMKLTNLTLESV